MRAIHIGSDLVPAIGQGTWKMGHEPSARSKEIDALRYGVEMGLTLIDTAEMYAEGGSERVVQEAIRDIRDRVFVVSKVWPTNQSGEGLINALHGSLDRLGLSQVDLYLLHWPSQRHPLSETLEALAQVREEKLARYVGVSNFPTPHLQKAQALMPSHIKLAADQVEYHLLNRRAETALIRYASLHQVAVMAYSPVKDLASLNKNAAPYGVLKKLADRKNVSPEAVALAYLIGSGPVIAIPKAVQRHHIDANRAALDIELSDEERTALQDAFLSPEEELPYEAL